MEEKFNVEHQYQLYLKKMKLSEDKMFPIQKKQLKQTFYAATAQILLLILDEITNLSDEEAHEAVKGMMEEIHAFFKEEARKLANDSGLYN